MEVKTQGTIIYSQSKMLNQGVTHAFFSRHGGVSPAPWASLNFGSTVGDEQQNVTTNKSKALACIDRDPASIYDVWQVHGTTVAIPEGPRMPSMPHIQADVILTDKPEVTLLMRFADCVPILLFDPIRRVIGIVHAGWQGTVKGIAKIAVEEMKKTFGTHPNDVLAVIGPSIGPEHYQVGSEVVNHVREYFKERTDRILISKNGSFHFDLWKANQLLLEQVGVEQIDVTGICTYCKNRDWFSHRAEFGKTGRFGAVIALD